VRGCGSIYHCVHEELHVPLGALDRTLDHALHLEPDLAREARDSVDDGLTLRFIAHDPALADVVLPDFELRLDQRHHLSFQKGSDGRKDQFQRDE